VRARVQLVGKSTRVKNQIKCFLYFMGVEIPEEFLRTNWSANFIQWLSNLPQEQHPMSHTGSAVVLRGYIEELMQLRRLILANTKAIRVLAATDRYKEDYERLVRLPGIGPLSAMTLLTEIADIDRLTSMDKLKSFVGLAPSLQGSGDHEYEGGLTRRRSVHLRRILIECAWIAARTDTGLMVEFNTLASRMPRNKAIIRIASRLLARVRFVLKNKRDCA
jgi:transposase